jgi:hypothetical protein
VRARVLAAVVLCFTTGCLPGLPGLPGSQPTAEPTAVPTPDATPAPTRAPTPVPPDHPFCAPGTTPEFLFGFAELRRQVGAPMGDPIECEHPDPSSGDSLQLTTTGLAYYRQSTNTPTFFNGTDRWGLTASGLVHWTGDSLDPP